MLIFSSSSSFDARPPGDSAARRLARARLSGPFPLIVLSINLSGSDGTRPGRNFHSSRQGFFCRVIRDHHAVTVYELISSHREQGILAGFIGRIPFLRCCSFYENFNIVNFSYPVKTSCFIKGASTFHFKQNTVNISLHPPPLASARF